MDRRSVRTGQDIHIVTPIRNVLSAAIAVIMLSSPYAEAQVARSTRVDVGSDISNPIRTSLSTTISSDPQGRNPLTTKTIQIEINYRSPQTPGYVGSNSSGYNTSSVSGPRGYTGSRGIMGEAGPRGYTGSAGSIGGTGYTGSQGVQGYTGSAGVPGTPGFSGSRGAMGTAGSLGYTGSAGPADFIGLRGLPGVQGTTGLVGDRGFTGSKGNVGTVGIRGYTGSAAMSFRMIRVPGQTAVIANRVNAIMYLTAGPGISISASNNDITINNLAQVTGAAGEILRSNGTGGITSNSNLRYANGNLSVVGNITATRTISTISDDRLKVRLTPIEHALDKIKTLTGFYYKPNELAQTLGYQSEITELGVSAQAVAKVFPEVVSAAAADSEYLTVNYQELIPALIEAIKEQEAKIEHLRNQISIIESSPWAQEN